MPLPPQDTYVVNNPNVEQVVGNYDLESRLTSMEARQDHAIKHMNKAISKQNHQLKQAIKEMDDRSYTAIAEMTELLMNIDKKVENN